jgi:hypothetical protein
MGGSCSDQISTKLVSGSMAVRAELTDVFPSKSTVPQMMMWNPPGSGLQTPQAPRWAPTVVAYSTVPRRRDPHEGEKK